MNKQARTNNELQAIKVGTVYVKKTHTFCKVNANKDC